ncbi:50S ribosomal protein L30 [Halarchaeum salinum]|uniref:Large ribosomal subunit protein uL30 n=1 Tax=Halarchaeum salinum TaxID=489912 RepID=A0AAV3SAL7_9EURY
MQAVIQLRGEVDMRETVGDTLSMLNLHRVNHATFVPETDAYSGMIAKVNDYVAYGEPSLETVTALVANRADPLEGDADVDDEWVAENTDYDDVDDLARALYNEETTLREAGLSPAVRLHPPRGGHQGIKQPQSEGGQLGKQSTEEVDELLERMR